MKLNENETAKLKLLAFSQQKIDASELKLNHFPTHSYEEVFAALYGCPDESHKGIEEFIMKSPCHIKETMEANKSKKELFTFAQLCKLYELKNPLGRTK